MDAYPTHEPRFDAWILHSMSSGIVAIDAGGALTVLNAGAQRILGCPDGDPKASLGRDCRQVLASQPTVARLLLDALQGRTALSRAELTLEERPGRVGTIGFTLAPVTDERQRVRGAAMIFRDLTPFERNDEQERLRERLAALGQMAAGLAHEIRNPLAGMEVLAGLLRRRLADRPAELSLVEELTGQLRNVAHTVTASLDFVRPAAPRFRFVNPVGLVEDALTVAEARFPSTAALETDWPDDLPAVRVDEDQLRAVVTDLAVNALEAMTAGDAAREPQLRVRIQCCRAEPVGRAVRVDARGHATAVAEPARELVISVADSGPGVPAELREKIFYPFFTTKQRGSGVGLANAQKIVASHRGSIELESRAGQGATFRIRLPIPDAGDEDPMGGS